MNIVAKDKAPNIRIGVIDTGVNPWHSHVRGGVYGCRIFLGPDGAIGEDSDIRDLIGHGTAVAGVIRQYLPDAELFVLRVFDRSFSTYPSLVARAIFRAVAEECSFINLSLAMPPAFGSEVVALACAEALATGCSIVAAGDPARGELIPASLSGVVSAIANDLVPAGEIWEGDGPCRYIAAGYPRELTSREGNLWGNSFACARVTAYLASRSELSSKEGSIR